jgi:osmotically-inducible protein OsmY
MGVLVEDQTIELKTMAYLMDNPDIKRRLDVSATSYNLQLLLTGQAADSQARDQYVNWVRHLPQVRKVYNEVSVQPFRTLGDKTQDAYLTAKVNLALAKIPLKGFDPTRVKVTSESGVVYLMGLLNESEEKAVEEAVRFVNGVKQVVKIFERI